MNIKSKGYVYTIAFVFFFIIFSIPWLLGLADELIQNKFNSDSVILIIFALISIYFIYYSFMLFKIHNYKLEIKEDMIFYTFLTCREYRYLDIEKMFWKSLKLRSGKNLDIFKLTFKNGTKIIFCTNNLPQNEKDFIISTLPKKARRSFICRDWKIIF